MEIELLGTSDTIAGALDSVASLCSEQGFAGPRVDEIITAVGEALTNAMQHGHHFVAERRIVLRAWPNRGDVVVEVEDSGNGFDAIPPLPNLQKKLEGTERPTGWGVFLMRTLASEVVFSKPSHGGHRVHLRFAPAAPATPAPALIV
jgi:anti-sigma regulatory factor (Ser/Thr protein kinase)